MSIKKKRSYINDIIQQDKFVTIKKRIVSIITCKRRQNSGIYWNLKDKEKRVNELKN